MYLFDMLHQEGYNITSTVFLSKMHNFSLIIRQPGTNPNWETFYKITDQYSHQKSHGLQRQRQNEALSQIRGD